MSRFYHLDVEDDDEHLANICEHHLDKFGTSRENAEQTVRDLRAKAFEKHLDGKITRDEWIDLDNAYESQSLGADAPTVKD